MKRSKSQLQSNGYSLMFIRSMSTQQQEKLTPTHQRPAALYSHTLKVYQKPFAES